LKAKTNDVILQTFTKAIAFIILIFSLYLFFAGHNQPGGGFIGGLMTASALVLLYIAYDIKMVKKMIPFDFKKMIAVGMLTAVATGGGSFLFQKPFLTHAFGYFQLPFLGKTELATAVLFDLGVYLTVVGVTMTIILAIAEDED